MNAGAETDEALAKAAQQGSKPAFDHLVRRHKDRIYRLTRRYTGQADDAYDVLQDSFIAAWSALDRYDPSRPFLPWLQTIALNKCRDFARRGAVRRAVEQAISSFFENASVAPEAAEREDADRRLDRLDRAIATLTPYYKEPLLLTVVDGLSHQEAAAILNTSAKAIEMRLYRARRKLKEIMGDSGREG